MVARKPQGTRPPAEVTNSGGRRKPRVKGGDDGPETQKAYNAAYQRARADAKKYGTKKKK